MHMLHSQSDLDLDLLRALVALVRLCSVTAAGRAIGLTQSATSHALARLRTAFGDELLVRSARGMVATVRAEQLAEHARKILDQVDALARPPGEFDPSTARRTFAIAMSDGGQLLVLPALLEELARDAPSVAIAVRAPGSDDESKLASGELALRLGGHDGGRELYRQVLLEDRIVWLVRGRRGRPISLHDYVRRGRVRVARPTAEPRIERALAAAGLPAPPAVTVQSTLAALLVVLRSERVLTMTAEVSRALARSLPIRVVEPPVALGSVTIAQQWHARVHGDAAHAWLRARIKRITERRAWAHGASRST